MIFKASLDKTTKIITTLVSLLFLSVIILQVILFVRYQTWPTLATATLLIIIYIITYVYRPVDYRIENNRLIVHRPASNITLSRSDIKKIELLQDSKLRGTIRTFGVGGLFGYFGQFMNHEIGCMTWYATKRHNKAVLIEMNNRKKIIVTPDDAEQFVQQLQTAA